MTAVCCTALNCRAPAIFSFHGTAAFHSVSGRESINLKVRRGNKGSAPAPSLGVWWDIARDTSRNWPTDACAQGMGTSLRIMVVSICK